MTTAGHRAPDLLPGTLDLLILKTLSRGTMHGYGIAQRLEQVSDVCSKWGIALLAAFLPASRALRIDATAALKVE